MEPQSPGESKILMQKIGQCDNLEAYNRLVDEHGAWYVGWREHICSLLYKKGKTSKDIAKGCGISQSAAEKFLRMIPTKRESVIEMAMILGLNLEETNELLTRWAKFQRLYSKTPEDAIWVYLIQRGGAETQTEPAKLFQRYYQRYERLHQAYLEERKKAPEEKSRIPETKVAFDIIDEAAAKGSAASPAQDRNFARFMKKLLPAFDAGYQRLIDYIESLFPNIEKEDDEALGIVIDKPAERVQGLEDCAVRGVSPNESFEGHRHWQTAYYRRIQKLKTERKVPERIFLIALGIHMKMSAGEINNLLELAGMAPLCAKDRLEGAIAFYLAELYRLLPDEFPSVYLKELYGLFPDESTENAKTTVNPADELPGYIVDCLDEDELLQEGMAGYFYRRLEEMNISDRNEKKAAEKLLKWLDFT